MDLPRLKTGFCLLVCLGTAAACGDNPTDVGDTPRATQPTLQVSAAGGACAGQYPNAVTWYVKSGAPVAVATGDKEKPFASLAAAEAAAGPGDAIVVLHVPADMAALDGGITLKECQKLLGTGPSVTTASPEAARSKITNSAGDAVVLGDYSEVAGLHIELPGRHAIAAFNATGAYIHDNLITGWNQGLGVSDPILGAGYSQPAIGIVTDAGEVSEIHIRDNVLRDATSTGILVLATGVGSEATAVTHGNVILNIDGSGIFSGGRNAALWALSFDGATVNLTVTHTAVDNVGNHSDGIVAVACVGDLSQGCFPNPGLGSELNLVVRHYTYRDTDGVGGGASSGVETFTVPGSRLTFLMENSDIIGAFDSGVTIYNGFTNPGSDIIDLGGGALGSVGQNRIFGNGLLGGAGGTGLGLNLLLLGANVVAEHNWWGTPNGLQLGCPFPWPVDSSCALVVGATSTLDFEPWLTEDPRPDPGS